MSVTDAHTEHDTARRRIVAAAVKAACELAHLLRPRFIGQQQELLFVLLLDTKHGVRRVVELYRGTVCAASVRVAEILRPAIVENLPNVIIAHNHPSGDPTPSPEDQMVTRRLLGGG